MPVPGRIRIIGGHLRGSRLDVPALPGLRPTPDRLRETLFNWLQPSIAGARCLDLFAGTGALGIEAISRGAGEVVFVERDGALVQALRGNLQRLKVAATVHQASAGDWLGGAAAVFDVVFIDPPFADDHWLDALDRLRSARLLSVNALIYMESPREFRVDPGAGWQQVRSADVGAVAGALYRQAPALG